jgi:probable F420-dependent oxidoreductase
MRTLPIDVAFHDSPDQLPAFAAAVEERSAQLPDGFGDTGVWVAEASHDPFVALALASTTTSRVRLGTSVALAFARTPMATAYSAYDVHRLSGGRLVLGLGSQIKPHITRRYSMPWSRPAARMAEYVEALRAIFAAWQTGGRLSFRGEFYSHTLMPPLFDPGPLGYNAPPIWLAGVGPRMVETAGRVADGFIGHPLVSRAYLQDVLLPRLAAGRAQAVEQRPFTVSVMAITAVGRTDEELDVAVAAARRQIGFYASTPAYRPVLDHHGWGGLHEAAHRATLEGRWSELAGLVDDEVLDTLAVRGDPAAVRDGLIQRFGGLADRVTLSMPSSADPLLPLEVLAAP